MRASLKYAFFTTLAFAVGETASAAYGSALKSFDIALSSVSIDDDACVDAARFFCAVCCSASLAFARSKFAYASWRSPLLLCDAECATRAALRAAAHGVFIAAVSGCAIASRLLIF